MAFVHSKLYGLNYKITKVEDGYTARSIELPELHYVVGSRALVCSTINHAMTNALAARMRHWLYLPGAFSRYMYRWWSPTFDINLKLKLYDLVQSMPLKSRTLWVSKAERAYTVPLLEVMDPTHGNHLPEAIRLLALLGVVTVFVDGTESN